MIGTTTMAAPVTTYAAPATTVAAPSYAAAPMTTFAAAPTTTTIAAPTIAAPTYAAATYAAPTYAAAPMTTTIAAPTTQVASYVAPPAMAAPMMTTMAAPAMVAPAVTQTASFVAPPAVAAAPIGVPAMPAPPVSLTQGLPDPKQIEAQKLGYSKALEKQLGEAVSTVQQETKIEKQMVEFTTKKNIDLYYMQVDEKLTESLAQVDEEATIKHCELRKALVERQLQLNNQAQGMIMDYQMKKLLTECEMAKYQFAQKYVAEETKLANQFAKVDAAAHTGTAYAAPAAAVPAK